MFSSGLLHCVWLAVRVFRLCVNFQSVDRYLVMDISDNEPTKRRGLFWLTALEVLIHDPVVPIGLGLVLNWANIHTPASWGLRIQSWDTMPAHHTYRERQRPEPHSPLLWFSLSALDFPVMPVVQETSLSHRNLWGILRCKLYVCLCGTLLFYVLFLRLGLCVERMELGCRIHNTLARISCCQGLRWHWPVHPTEGVLAPCNVKFCAMFSFLCM